MHIWNIRRGFATNSSSSHSMLLLQEGKGYKDKDAEAPYGWGDFVLGSETAKHNYLIPLLFDSLRRSVGETIAKQVLRDLNLPATVDVENIPAVDIDHQSVFRFPVNANDVTNIQFAKEFLQWCMKKNVVILGGNDNSDGHPLTSKGPTINWAGVLADSVQAWKDDTTGAWTLFSKDNGLSLRFSFDDMPADGLSFYSNTPSSRPNLVDIKITDSCPFQCAYCYQGSTPKAPHASLSAVVEVAQALASEQVFEVALGGGEPTLHPDFAQIVDEFHSRGVVCNFTTRNTKWLQSSRAVEVLNKCKAVAVSVDTVEGAKVAVEAFKNISAQRLQTTLQIVVGAQPRADFEDILAVAFEAGVSITLLGYKDNGFGLAYKMSDDKQQQIATAHDNWTQWTLEAYNRHVKSANLKYIPTLWVNIDTALAERSQTVLDTLEGKRTMYHTVEGAQSMYIDAVKNTMAPSSFAHSSAYVAWDKATWLEAFQRFTAPKKLAIK